MAKYTIGKIWLHVVREGELYWGIQQKNCIKIDNGVDNEFKRIQFRKWPSKKKSSLLIFGRAFFTAGGSRRRWLAWWSAASALTSSSGVVTLAPRRCFYSGTFAIESACATWRPSLRRRWNCQSNPILNSKSNEHSLQQRNRLFKVGIYFE